MGRFALRFAVGGFFIGHGTQKLFGWFGGRGLAATGENFEKLGLRPGKANALAAGVAEAGGGALLAAGLATPAAAAVLTATMLTAIHRVHLKNGPWAFNGGYEYNAVLIAAVLEIAESGPGKLSLDAAFGRRPGGRGRGARTLAAGVLGAVGVHVLAERERRHRESLASPRDEPAG